jgi:hypothetical protein
VGEQGREGVDVVYAPRAYPFGQLAQVVAAAAQSGFVSAAAVRARCEMRGGSFFDDVPAAPTATS